MGPPILISVFSSRTGVSIQLIAPASGAKVSKKLFNEMKRVSIQLIAPASGAPVRIAGGTTSAPSFHSTDCPSEWGLDRSILGYPC